MREVWRETRETLRQIPPLRHLLLATVVNSFIQGLLIVALPLFLLDKGFTFFQLGAAFSLTAFATILVQLAAGRNQQLFGRPAVVLAALVLPVLIFPLYLLARTPGQFVLLAAVASVASAAAAPGLQLATAAIAPPSSRATVFSYLGVVFSFSYGTAILVSGLLLTISYRLLFLTGAALALLSLVLVAPILLGGPALRWRRRPLADLEPETRDAVAALRRHERALAAWRGRIASTRVAASLALPVPRATRRNTLLVFVHLLAFQLSMAVYPVFFPQYLRSEGLPTRWVGAAVAASWFVFGLCQPFGGRMADRTKRHRTIIAASLLAAAALNVVLALTPLAWILLAWILLGVADGFGRPATSALIIQGVPEAFRGGALGAASVAERAARILAPLGLAFAMQGGGVPAALLIVAGILVASIVPILLLPPYGPAAADSSPRIAERQTA